MSRMKNTGKAIGRNGEREKNMIEDRPPLQESRKARKGKMIRRDNRGNDGPDKAGAADGPAQTIVRGQEKKSAARGHNHGTDGGP